MCFIMIFKNDKVKAMKFLKRVETIERSFLTVLLFFAASFNCLLLMKNRTTIAPSYNRPFEPPIPCPPQLSHFILLGQTVGQYVRQVPSI